MKTGLTPLGILAMALFGILVLAALPGCMGVPRGAAEKWVHDGHYGPVTTHYEAHAIVSQPDGTLKIGTYNGAITVLGGYGISDTVEGLVVTPAK